MWTVQPHGSTIPSSNVQLGDVVCVHSNPYIPLEWCTYSYDLPAMSVVARWVECSGGGYTAGSARDVTLADI